MRGGPPGMRSIAPAVFAPSSQSESSEPVRVSSWEAAPGDGVQSLSDSFEELRQQVYEAAEKLTTGSNAAGKPLGREEISGAPRLAPPAGSGAVSCYRDPHGVLHITCREAREVKAPQAASGPAPLEKSSLSSPRLSAIQPVDLAAAAVAPAASPATISAGLSSIPEDAIQHYRDQHGVWRITNKPGREISPLPAQPVVHIAGVPAPLNPGMGAGPRIFARRDWQGVCHIFNQAAELVRDRSSPVAFLGKLPSELESIIVETAQTYRLPVPLILALIHNESNFAPQAVSPKGAMGLMQLMPGTAQLLGVQDPFSPQENIHGGCRYLRYLLDSFQGSMPLALAAYNAGSQRVISAGYQIPQIKETQGFVTQVMALYYLLDKLSAL